jgi:hypothetical protein
MHDDDVDDDIDRLDPDWDDVPPELREHHLERVFVIDQDGVEAATLVVTPGFWGHARRRREQREQLDDDDAA